MLDKLQIRNFRRNKKLDIEFGRITVIRGPSGKGKSSLVGALKLVCFNRPSGDSFINWDSDFCSVRLFVDGHKIVRKKSSSKNIYRLDKQKYEAFGTGVPEDIANLLNVTDINFHRQHSGPFWFSKTAGEVSKQLNKIVNLEVIDSTLANLAKVQRETRIRKTLAETELKKLRADKNKLRFVIVLNKELKALETEQIALDEISQNALQLTELVEGGAKYVSERFNAAQQASDANFAMSAGGLYVKIDKKRQKLNELLEKARKYERILSRTIPNIKPAIQAHDTWQGVYSQKEMLSELLGKAEGLEEAIHRIGRTLEAKQKRFDKLMGKRCILCGSGLKK